MYLPDARLTVMTGCRPQHGRKSLPGEHGLPASECRGARDPANCNGTGLSPFSYHGTGGRLTGFDVEIAEEVARHMELRAEFVETEWENLRQD